MSFGFNWDLYVKNMTTMLVGPSTELELALYTLCFKARPGRYCNMNLGDFRRPILTRIDKNKELSAAHFVIG